MYTYVRLNELPHGTSTVMGLSAVFMIISEVPFFYYSGPLVTRFGAMPILAVALACQFARQLWIACLWDARWVLPGELLHGLTYSVANAALTVYIRQIAPLELRNTAQAILSTVFVGLGQGAASLLGGFMIQRFGARAPEQGSPPPLASRGGGIAALGPARPEGDFRASPRHRGSFPHQRALCTLRGRAAGIRGSKQQTASLTFQ